MVPRIWMLCVTIAQNVTLTCFLWLLYHQLKLWSTYLSPSKSVREKVCFCPLRCLVCNGFVVSHLQENKTLGRFVSWVGVCRLLTTSLTTVPVQVCGGKHVSCCPHPFVGRCIHRAVGISVGECLSSMHEGLGSVSNNWKPFCSAIIPSAWEVIIGGPEVIPGSIVVRG